jgi:hypothetical protein
MGAYLTPLSLTSEAATHARDLNHRGLLFKQRGCSENYRFPELIYHQLVSQKSPNVRQNSLRQKS